MIIIGVDTGGTFTDLIFKEGERWSIYKLLSTPVNPAKAVLKGIERVASGKSRQIVHGSTVATNAILERKGVRTALITNKGFEDVLQIGRQNRSRLYDLAYRKEPRLVSRELTFGVSGRIQRTGEILEDLHQADCATLLDKLRHAGVESVAVCFLFSFVNPIHENRIKNALDELELPVSLSHEVLSEFREYERTSTTVINAYVSPKMKGYISHLMDSLESGDRLRIMQSNGGAISAQTAMNESVRTILSGPAGGAVGAFEVGKTAGYDRLISFDMGGTSTDVSLMDGKLSLTLESSIAGHPVKVPMIDIHTVGAGGGSMARVDPGGSLKVGPQSAGADPGPICYGKGDRITVTDADLYLGRLVPEHFLGGQMKLHRDRLEESFRLMAVQTGLSTVELAEGILSVAHTTMERAIRLISVQRGYDPREFTLLSFGGAGGLHASFLARLLDIPRVLVPQNPGILSAIGMLMADIVKDYSLTVMLAQSEAKEEHLLNLFRSLEERGESDLRSEGISGKGITTERYLDMRYQGQSYEIIVPFDQEFVETFHRLHEKTYGYRNEGKPVEIVNIRLRARAAPDKPGFERAPVGSVTPLAEAILEERDVIFSSRPMRTRIIDRGKLRSGNVLTGPAIIVEYSSTIVIPPFAKGCVDEYGNLIIDIG
jgi:N-methylhydantoinase A